jgi:mersacidin/lichenicidin family type 2 lantibiotic
MRKIDVVRAWKDEAYRLGLNEEERAQLPVNPAGIVDLSDADLMSVMGGAEIAPLDDGGCTCCCTCCTCCC